MLVQVNTDNNINGTEAMIKFVQAEVEAELARFDDQLTRVEVHFSDLNSKHKNGEKDLQCRLEARPSGTQPLSVSEQAESVDLALRGALDKLERKLESHFGRLANR